MSNNKKATNGEDQRPSSKISVPMGVIQNLDAARETVNRHPDLSPRERLFLNVILDVGSDLFHNQSETPVFNLQAMSIALMKAGAPLRESTIRYRIFKLIKAGFIRSQELPTNKAYPSAKPREYLVADLHQPNFQSIDEEYAAAYLGGRRSERTNRSRKIVDHLRQHSEQFALITDATKHRTDNIWTGLADRVYRFSPREQPEDNVIRTAVRMHGAQILLKATTETGSSGEITTLQDQRVIRAIISQVASHIDERKQRWFQDRGAHLMEQSTIDDAGNINDQSDELSDEDFEDLCSYIDNSFYIDVRDTAQLMGYSTPSSGTSRQAVNAAIRRLYNTNIRIAIDLEDKNTSQADIKRALMAYGLRDYVKDFRFITDLTSEFSDKFIQSVNTGNALDFDDPSIAPEQKDAAIDAALDPAKNGDFNRVRTWLISIDRHLYEKLLRDTRSALFTAHAEIMRDNNGLAQTLYNFISHTVGRTDPAYSGKQGYYCQTLDVLHKTLWPWRYYSRFESKIIQIFRNHMGDDFDSSLKHNTATMWGYRLTLCRKQDKLKLYAERDPYDSLTGDNSFHNQKIRAEANRKRINISPGARNSQSKLDL